MGHNIGKTAQKIGHSVNLERTILAVEVGLMALATGTGTHHSSNRGCDNGGKKEHPEPNYKVSPVVVDRFSNRGARVRICQWDAILTLSILQWGIVQNHFVGPIYR